MLPLGAVATAPVAMIAEAATQPMAAAASSAALPAPAPAPDAVQAALLQLAQQLAAGQTAGLPELARLLPAAAVPAAAVPAAAVPAAAVPAAVVPAATAPAAMAPAAMVPAAVAPAVMAPTAMAPAAMAPTAMAPTAMAPTAMAPTATAPMTAEAPLQLQGQSVVPLPGPGSEATTPATMVAVAPVPAPAPVPATAPVPMPSAAAAPGAMEGTVVTPMPALAAAVVPPGAYVGVVKSFNPVKGFGFITSQGFEGDLFFLRTELPAELHTGEGSALQGRSVTFELLNSKEGRSRAAHIRLLPTEGEPITGTIKSYSERNGYGFISASSLSRDVHFKNYDLPAPYQGSDSSILVGKRVTFQVEVLKDGKLKALQLQIMDAAEPPALLPASNQSQQNNAQLRGFVKSYDAAKGLGVLQAPGVADELHFQENLSFAPALGQEVGFSLDWLPDGSIQATNVSSLIAPTNVVLFDGADLVGTVKSFHELKGFGFINVANQPDDLYFQRRDLALDLQTHMQQGASLVGATVHFRLEATTYGRWHARNIGLSQPEPRQSLPALSGGPAMDVSLQQTEGAAQLYDGAELTGVIKSYHEAKGYGFVNVPGQTTDLYFQTRDLAPGALQALQQQQGSADIAGTWVRFRLQGLPDGRWHARSVEPAHQRPSPVTAAAGAGGGGGLLDGAAMVGTVKSYNERNGYGFITAAGHAADIYFQPIDFSYELQQQLQGQGVGGLAAGVAVHFWVQELPGGRWRAREVSFQPPQQDGGQWWPADGSPSAYQEAPVSVLCDGAELLGTVKSYNDHKGYGFLNVEGEQVDLYFQTRDLTPDTRQQLQQGCGLVGSTVCFWLQALPDGRCGKWRARDVGLADPPPKSEKRALTDVLPGVEGADGASPLKQYRAAPGTGTGPAAISSLALPPVPSPTGAASTADAPALPDATFSGGFLSDGQSTRLLGNVKSFSSQKGFGFLTAPGFNEDIFFLRSELLGGEVDQGCKVSFDLSSMPDGKLRASRVTMEP